MDIDVYGPNVPIMLGASEARPEVEVNKLVPIEAYGVKLMSMALLQPGDKPMIVRGPILHGLVKQFLSDVKWGELDYLIVDMPPGTGDVQLSLAQLVPVQGAVLVTTPQDVAVADVHAHCVCLRLLLFRCAAALGEIERIECDRGRVAGAVLHDYAFVTMDTVTDTCFTLVGAEAATDLLAASPLSAALQHDVLESITLHLNPAVDREQSELAHLVHDGVLVDVVGTRAWELDADGVTLSAARLQRPRRAGAANPRASGTGLPGGRALPGWLWGWSATQPMARSRPGRRPPIESRGDEAGLIGAGNMASALARGIGEPVLVHDVDEAQGAGAGRELGGEAVASNAELAERADALVLCHKPAQLEEVADAGARPRARW